MPPDVFPLHGSHGTLRHRRETDCVPHAGVRAAGCVRHTARAMPGRRWSFVQHGSQQPRPARARYTARAEEYRNRCGLSFSALARTMSASGWRTFDRATATAAVRGHQSGKEHLLPTRETVEHLDRALGADGELLTLWQDASIEDHAIGIGAPPRATTAAATGRAPEQAATVEHGEEVSPTRRRDALRSGLALGSAAVAAALAERIAAADSRPASLDQYEAEIHQIARTYRTTSHVKLAERLEPAWLSTERLLDTRVSSKVRSRLTWIAGWQAFYLGTLGFDTDNDQAAREFLALASQHATDTGDRLLAGSAAAMRSTVAYFNAAYDTAADIAHEAGQEAHPYSQPILAGCEARSAALAGRPDDAQTALARMQDHVWDSGVLPGPNPGDEAFAHAFLAVTLSHLGHGQTAESHVRTGLDLELANGPDNYVQISGNWTVLGMTFLHRAHPDPEQAAAAAREALLVLDTTPTRGAIQRAGDMLRQMTSRWPELPAVRDLGDVVAQSRLALPTDI